MGFSLDLQAQINTLLHYTYIDIEHWIVEEIYTAAINIFNTQTCPLIFINKSRNYFMSRVVYFQV